MITTYVTKGRTSSDMKCRLPCNTEYLSAAPSILRVLTVGPWADVKNDFT